MATRKKAAQKAAAVEINPAAVQAAEVKKTDAEIRPCLVPDRHVNECDCYGVIVRRNPLIPNHLERK